MKAKKTGLDYADIEVANESWSEDDRKAFTKFLKSKKNQYILSAMAKSV